MKEILSGDLLEKAKKIRYFFTDVDGTLTDGGVYYSSNGEYLKKFSMRDGTGFFLLRQSGIKTGIITSEDSPIVKSRANKLKVDKYLFGTTNKVKSLNEILSEESLTFDNVAYIGDEINDIKLIKMCGLSFAVADADERVKKQAHIICTHKGGHGAFREAAERFLCLLGIDINLIIEKSL